MAVGRLAVERLALPTTEYETHRRSQRKRSDAMAAARLAERLVRGDKNVRPQPSLSSCSAS